MLPGNLVLYPGLITFIIMKALILNVLDNLFSLCSPEWMSTIARDLSPLDMFAHEGVFFFYFPAAVLR